MGKISLSDIVSLPAFEAAGELFNRVTGMTLSFHDENQNIIFYPVRERTRFCRMIQSTEKGNKACMSSDNHAAEKAMSLGTPVSYTCHAGLTDVVVPVVVGDERIGCFFSGQTHLISPAMPGHHQVRKAAAELGLDPDELVEAYLEVPVVESSRLDLATGLLRVICNHLVEGQIALRQQSLLAQEQSKLLQAAENTARLERDLREMELRLLQAQLNPHFLFNALNLIIGHAMKEGAPETRHLVEELSLLLRNSLCRVGSLIPLCEEMESARAYVEIFRARFLKDVSLQVDLQEDLSSYKVPALILQPFVENALIHALPRCKGVLNMRLSARTVDGFVEIRATDNGAGLSRREMSVLAKSIASSDYQGKLTGLVGVNVRLKYYYRSIPDIRLESAGSGLTVIIRLPVGASQDRPL